MRSAALAPPPTVAAPPRSAVVTVLAGRELVRMLRSPWLWIGAALSVVQLWPLVGPQEWHGARYGAWTWTPGGFYLGTSVVLAISFNRERAALAADAPIGELDRCLSKLLAGCGLVLITALFVVGIMGYVWSIGGVDLGDEPGRTLHAYPTLAELVQPLCLAVLAVSVGAAAGRRLRHRVAAVLVLVGGWLQATDFYWLYSGALLNPVSIVQTQPITVDAAPPTADPLRLPSDWLLVSPGEYQPSWGRLVVSEPVVWWHAGWLIGLSLLCVAAAFPAGARLRLATAGGTLALVSAVAQYLVYP
jgi:hypothetical protein